MSARDHDSTTSIHADDALIDAVGSGRRVDDHDVGELLSAWHAELRSATPASASSLPVIDARGPVRPSVERRGMRVAIGSFAAAAVIATGGVAAAAVSPTGPLAGLHRALFGASHSDRAAARVASLLDAAQRRIDTARAAGVISPDDRTLAARDLDQASDLLRREVHGHQELQARLIDLRAALAAIPVDAPPAAPSVSTPPSVPTAPGASPPATERTAANTAGHTPAPATADDGGQEPSSANDPDSPGASTGEPSPAPQPRPTDTGSPAANDPVGSTDPSTVESSTAATGADGAEAGD